MEAAAAAEAMLPFEKSSQRETGKAEIENLFCKENETRDLF